MGSLDVNTLFTNIPPLEETINLSTNLLYNNKDVIEGTNKSKFKNLLSLTTQESHFTFNNFFINKRMAWPQDHLLDLLWQMFSCHFMKSNGFNSTQSNLNQFFTEDMLMIFLLLFALFLIVSILVIQTRKNGKLSFLDIEVSREKGKFVTNAYKKPTFCCMYTHFENFLPTVYKFGMVYTYLSLFQYLFCLEKVS